MARKHKKKKGGTSHRRRRSVGAVHPAIMQTGIMLAGAGVGAIAGVFAYQALKTSVTSAPPVALAGGIAIVGGLIPLFVKPSPFVMGAAAGMAGTGIVFAVNEAGLSLPGISGTPMGVPSARPGYVNTTVGYIDRGYPPRTVGGGGNLSGNLQSVVAGILRN